jgi:glycosyltransferase involved in cell wall biosynthesis
MLADRKYQSRSISQLECASHRPARIYVNGRFLQQPITGIQRYGRELLQVWDELIDIGEIDSNQVTIEVLVPRAKLDAPQLRHIKVRQVGRFQGQLWTQLELPAQSRDGLLFSPDNLQPLLAPLLGPSVVTVHDLTFKLFPRAHTTPFRLLYGLLISNGIRNATALITCSEAEKKNILGHYPSARDRIAVVHLGAKSAQRPAANEVEKPDQQPTERYMLWVGSLISRKNPQGAIDAALLVNQQMRLPLIVVGSGHRGMQKTHIRAPGNDGVIQLANRISSSEDVIELYRNAVCLLFPTFYEGFGLPALEAMAYGCPVVTSDIPVMREVCGDAALYCNPNEPGDIADKVKMLAQSSEMREQLRRRGFGRAAQFSWERCARETFEVLRRVIAERGAYGLISRSPEWCSRRPNDSVVSDRCHRIEFCGQSDRADIS